MTTYWLLEVWGGVSSEMHGPFDWAELRDSFALERLRKSDESSFHRLNIVNGVPEVYDFSGGEVKGEPT